MKFTTYDRDNDPYSVNCASDWKGAWWYNYCHHSNLNGLYLKAGDSSSKGIRWRHWKNLNSKKKTEMKIRPAEF